MRLRIQIDQADALPHLRQGSTQVGGGGGLTDATFLVHERNDAHGAEDIEDGGSKIEDCGLKMEDRDRRIFCALAILHPPSSILSSSYSLGTLKYNGLVFPGLMLLRSIINAARRCTARVGLPVPAFRQPCKSK